MSVQRILGAHSSLLSKIFVSGTTKGFGAIFTFLSFVVIARASSAEEFGRFSMAFAIATILSFVFVGGQHRTVLKFYPKYSLEDDGGRAASFILKMATRNLVAFILVGVLVVLALASGLQMAGVRFDVRLPLEVVFWAIGLASLMSIAEFLANFYRAKDRLLFSLLPRDVVWRLLICCVIGTLLYLQAGASLEAELIGAPFALAILSLLLLVAILPQLVGWFSNLKSKADLSSKQRDLIVGEYRHATLPFWGLAMVWPIQTQIGVLLVGFLIGEADTGAYFSAQKLSGLLAIVSVAINQAIEPILSRASARNDVGEMRKVFIVSCLVGGAISICAFAIYLGFGNVLLGLFDPAYTGFYGVLMILCFGQVIFNVTGPAALMLSLVGRERFVLAVTTTAAILGTFAISLCTIWFGVYGTAAAVAATTCAWNTVFFVAALKYLKTDRQTST